MRTRSSGASRTTSAPSTPATGKPKSFLRRGAAIQKEAVAHQADIEKRRSQGGNILRFYVKKGEECEIVILDHSLEDGAAFYEHMTQDENGKWGNHTICTKEFPGGCPTCNSGSNSYYVLMLSCLCLKPFTTRDGREVKQSKMLLPVKIGQFDLFRRLEEAAKKKGGSLRGMYLVMARSKTDAKAPRIGEPTILDDGTMFELLTEEQLDEEFGHDAILGQDKKTIVRPENFDITPFDYEKIFTLPAQGEQGPATGSQEEALNEFNEKDEDDDKVSTSTRTRRRAEAPAAEQDPEDGEGGEEGAPEETSTRRRGAPASAPASSRTRRNPFSGARK